MVPRVFIGCSWSVTYNESHLGSDKHFDMAYSVSSLTQARMNKNIAKANYPKADLDVYRCARAMRTVVPSIAFFLFLFGSYLRATSIVSVSTPNAIFIVSDSNMING